MVTEDSVEGWEPQFRSFIEGSTAADGAHGLPHIERVVKNARRIAAAEQADLRVVLPAAWLHDCVAVAKDAPDRARASTYAADAAVTFLRRRSFPASFLPAIHHAIQAHSFSANITPRSLEARVVQDADRLDALGAIGLARCFVVGGRLGLALYHPEDPFGERRAALDDRQYSIDHFYVKLLRLPDQMQTAAGRALARERAGYLRDFLERLRAELHG